MLALLIIWFIFFKNSQFSGLGFKDIDTHYNRVILVKDVDQETQRPVLHLIPDLGFVHSSIYLDKDTGPVHRYKKYYRLDGHFVSDVKRGLFIGGAGYSYPKDFLKRYPDAQMDVVEIDPQMTKIAKEFFNLKENERLDVYHEDARRFLEREAEKEEKKYDTIYVDAFLSSFVVPYQLTTKEAVEKMYVLLNDGGVVFLNLVSSLEGEGSKFIAAEYKTYKSVFPQVYVFRVQEERSLDAAQNLILVALKTKKQPDLENADEELNSYLASLWSSGFIDMPVIKDDFAPIDQYLLELY